MTPDQIKEAFEQLAKAVQAVVDVLNDKLSELWKFAVDIQEAIDERAEERKRWGPPPKKMIAVYKEPMKRIRPCARAFRRR